MAPVVPGQISRQSARTHLQICEELPTHDAFQQQVYALSILEGCYKVDEEGEVTVSHDLGFSWRSSYFVDSSRRRCIATGSTSEESNLDSAAHADDFCFS